MINETFEENLTNGCYCSNCERSVAAEKSLTVYLGGGGDHLLFSFLTLKQQQVAGRHQQEETIEL